MDTDILDIASSYMNDYKNEMNINNNKIGIFGRLWEYLCGTFIYSKIENKLYEKYHLTYNQAYIILFDTNNLRHIYIKRLKDRNK